MFWQRIKGVGLHVSIMDNFTGWEYSIGFYPFHWTLLTRINPFFVTTWGPIRISVQRRNP